MIYRSWNYRPIRSLQAKRSSFSTVPLYSRYEIPGAQRPDSAGTCTKALMLLL